MRETGGMGWGDGTRDAGLGFACFFLRFEKGFWCSGDRADFLFVVTNNYCNTRSHHHTAAFTKGGYNCIPPCVHKQLQQQFSEQRLDSTVLEYLGIHGAVLYYHW